MNRIFNITIGVALALAVLWIAPPSAFSGQSVTKQESEGTVTYKVTLDVDSLASFGSGHNTPDAVKSNWFSVPFGVPFAVFIEARDLDSSIAFSDSLYVALESAPEGSLALTSTNTKAYKLPYFVFGSGNTAYQNWPQRDYFTWAPADTNATDTTGGTGADAAMAAVGGTATLRGYGKYRFSLCSGDNDSTADGGIRFNAYLSYQRKEAGTGN